jgi:hypothetical protein
LDGSYQEVHDESGDDPLISRKVRDNKLYSYFNVVIKRKLHISQNELLSALSCLDDGVDGVTGFALKLTNPLQSLIVCELSVLCLFRTNV